MWNRALYRAVWEYENWSFTIISRITVDKKERRILCSLVREKGREWESLRERERERERKREKERERERGGGREGGRERRREIIFYFIDFCFAYVNKISVLFIYLFTTYLFPWTPDIFFFQETTSIRFKYLLGNPSNNKKQIKNKQYWVWCGHSRKKKKK